MIRVVGRLSIAYRLDLQGRVNLTLQLGDSFEGKESLMFLEEAEILTAPPLLSDYEIAIRFTKSEETPLKFSCMFLHER